MTNRNIIAFACLIILFFSCKKDIEFSPQDISCTLENGNHPLDEVYRGIINKYAEKGITGLTVIMDKQGEEQWLGSAGFSNVESGTKMNPCHLHHMASLSKSFTGAVTLQLIEEGQLSLETKIKDLLDNDLSPFIPNFDEITVSDLLQHTSGIPDIFGIEFFAALMNDPEAVYTTRELLELNEGADALNGVGIKHNYADPNYMLLSLIIDKLEGDHATSFNNRIMAKLNLNNTHYHDDNYPNSLGLCSSYWEQYENGSIENISDVQNRLTSYILGSDGIIASPSDMVYFFKEVFHGNLLNQENLTYLRNEVVKEEEENRMNTGYSHGFMVIDDEWFGHAGLQIGASCFVFHHIESGSTIGVFTNMGTFLSQEKKELIYVDLWNELKELM